MEDIDWSAVDAAYGPATPVPTLIQQLANARSEERDDAIGELWSCLCHQGTVYAASAVAVPYLYQAAKAPHLRSAERDQLLALIAHIGLGEDTTWEGYTSWAVVQDCAGAVEAVLPDLMAWALQGAPEARRWALAVAAYHPDVWATLGTDTATLMPAAESEVADLVVAAVSKTIPTQRVVDAVVAFNEDLRDYYETVIRELPADRHARRLVLELAVIGRL